MCLDLKLQLLRSYSLRKMAGRHFVCIWIFCVVLQGFADRSELLQKHENDAEQHGPAWASTGARNQDKPKRLFARTRYLSPPRLHNKPKPEPAGAAPSPPRRCAGLTESCSGRMPCCEPCASCHCRLFNTICHCWKLGTCPIKT